MRRLKIVSITSLGVFFCACLYCPVFHAMPKFMDRYDADLYAKPENKGRCMVCHTNEEGFGPLNKFGQAFVSSGYRITDDLRSKIPEVFVSSLEGAAKSEPKFDAQAFYKTNCVVCHGEDGKGGGGSRSTMIVPDFTNALWQRRNPDEKLINVISNGKGVMPAFKDKMNEEQIKSIVAHIRTFSKQK